jgi:hypothetical protein
MKLSWLDKYWVVSIVAFPASLLGLSLSVQPDWSDIETWSFVVTLSFGVAASSALIFVCLIGAVMLIPSAISRIHGEGRGEMLSIWAESIRVLNRSEQTKLLNALKRKLTPEEMDRLSRLLESTGIHVSQ